jgi:hypothetical protein
MLFEPIYKFFYIKILDFNLKKALNTILKKRLISNKYILIY